MSSSKDHFTVVLEIHEVKYQLARVSGRDDWQREKLDVARIVVRDETLSGLVRKVKGHLDMVDDRTPDSLTISARGDFPHPADTPE